MKSILGFTALALGIIDMCDIVLHMNCIKVTLFLTDFTSDASYGTDFFHRFAHIFVITMYFGHLPFYILLLIWNQFDQGFRADCDTFATCYAFFLIYYSDTIDHMYGVKITDLGTAAKTGTSVGTSFGASSRNTDG